MHGGLSLSSTSFQPNDGIVMGARLTLHKGLILLLVSGNLDTHSILSFGHIRAMS